MAAAGQSRDGGQGEGSRCPTGTPVCLEGGRALPAGRGPARRGCWVLHASGRGLAPGMGQRTGGRVGTLPGSHQHPLPNLMSAFSGVRQREPLMAGSGGRAWCWLPEPPNSAFISSFLSINPAPGRPILPPAPRQGPPPRSSPAAVRKAATAGGCGGDPSVGRALLLPVVPPAPAS